MGWCVGVAVLSVERTRMRVESGGCMEQQQQRQPPLPLPLTCWSSSGSNPSNPCGVVRMRECVCARESVCACTRSNAGAEPHARGHACTHARTHLHHILFLFLALLVLWGRRCCWYQWGGRLLLPPGCGALLAAPLHRSADLQPSTPSGVPRCGGQRVGGEAASSV